MGSRFDVSDDLHGPKCTDCHQDAELQFTVVEDGHQAFEIRFFLTPLYFANAMTHFEIEISFPDTTPLAAGRRLLNQGNSDVGTELEPHIQPNRGTRGTSVR